MVTLAVTPLITLVVTPLVTHLVTFVVTSLVTPLVTLVVTPVQVVDVRLYGANRQSSQMWVHLQHAFTFFWTSGVRVCVGGGGGGGAHKQT